MEVLIFINETDMMKDKVQPASVHCDYSTLSDEDRAKGHKAILPVTEAKEGYQSILYVNPKTYELWYEYEQIVIPKTQEQILQDRISALEIALANMMGV